MRKATINLITLYMLLGSILSSVILLILWSAGANIEQVIFTTILSNLVIVHFIRMLSIKHEQTMCIKKKEILRVNEN